MESFNTKRWITCLVYAPKNLRNFPIVQKDSWELGGQCVEHPAGVSQQMRWEAKNGTLMTQNPYHKKVTVSASQMLSEFQQGSQLRYHKL